MEGLSFTEICSIIILIASTITASVTIYNSLKRPAKKYKERHDAETKELVVKTTKEIMPTLFEAHDLETRDKYLEDREKYLREIKTEILTELQSTLDQINRALEQLNVLQVEYDNLLISARDVLREKIIKIYLDNKENKSLSTLDSERLEQFYKDYKNLNGNSYIDKYYKRMKKWDVIDDDYTDDDDVL